MNREEELDALAESVKQARPSWSARLARRGLVKAAPFAVFSAAAGVLLARIGVHLGSLLAPMVLAGPFIVVAVVGFVAHAWRQNTGLTYVPPASQVDLATEPGQVGQPILGQVEPEEAGQLARPTQPTTVTVTVLPGPTAALPQAVGQTSPIHYADEEETR